ncbi:MAG: STAS/SEC14 domain-containing protein [Mucilaginibacter sp.]|uniref:STAS/SEC14 domain-containing protein n=1 Tax=Mucilaginibacter sp. TaxID=1882438 RepID=UPI0031B25D34
MIYLPAHVLGIHAVGDVTINDYRKALLPLLKEQVRRNHKINFVLVLEANIKNFNAGAWCGNIEMGLKYFLRWNKLAIVSDQKDARSFSDLFKYILPGKYRGYALEDIDEAIKWVSEK